MQDGEGFENCLEQHITPDVAFFLQQIYRVQGDLDWLRENYHVVSGVADCTERATYEK